MERDREDRHWKNARADLCGSAAGSIRIFPRRHAADRQTNRADRATQSDPKGFLSSLRFHHERLRTLSILDRNGGPQTAGIDLVYGKNYPTEPSISSSINRFSSTEYSIGNWRTRSLTNPFTLKLIACALVKPRCCM